MARTRRRTLTLGAGFVMVVGAAFAALLLPRSSEDPARSTQQDRLELEAPADVTISSEAEGTIAPGVTVPLNLSFDNPNDFPLALGKVQVTVADIEAPEAEPGLPCTADDYSVRQLDADPRLTIAADSVTDLRDLDLAKNRWPAVTLAPRPVNQDGCKGATLTLTYETLGLGAPS